MKNIKREQWKSENVIRRNRISIFYQYLKIYHILKTRQNTAKFDSHMVHEFSEEMKLLLLKPDSN